MNYKTIKKIVKQTLQHNTPANSIGVLNKFSNHQLINPLIGLLYDPDQLIKFRAIELLGIISSDIFTNDPEKIRVLMRRFIWSLNEESGGIGWGSAEAMGEIASRNEKLFNEFSKIIVSYLDPESTSFLDHKELHPGILWAIGKMGKSFPITGEFSEYVIKETIKDPDPRIRGLSIWVCLNCKIKSLYKEIEGLTNDKGEFLLFDEGKLLNVEISNAAKKALKLIDRH